MWQCNGWSQGGALIILSHFYHTTEIQSPHRWPLDNALLIFIPPSPSSLAPFISKQVIKTFSTREGWWYIGIKGEMVV